MSRAVGCFSASQQFSQLLLARVWVTFIALGSNSNWEGPLKK